MTRFHNIIRCLALLLISWLVLELPAAPAALAQSEGINKRKIRTTMLTSRRRAPSLNLDEIRKSIEENPDDALLYYRAGLLEQKRGELEQALDYFKESIKRKARLADAWYRTGLIWEKIGEIYAFESVAKGRVIIGPQRKKAIDAYQEAIRAKSDFTDAYYRLCLVYLVGDDLEEANKAYRLLHELEPKSDRANNLLLMIYRQQQDQSKNRRRISKVQQSSHASGARG
ncbi:MAG: tetratricopeptide repeat protein [Gemmatimonadota bacterium]|nr:tetratricopeptide repeat protein [Gemmatimonadota bacterium]